MTDDAHARPFREPGTAVAEAGIVLLGDPDSIAISLTPEAAEAAGESLVAAFRDVDAHSRSTFPIVLRLTDRTCVELRSWATDGAGSYTVCYDARSGRKLSEQANTGF